MAADAETKQSSQFVAVYCLLIRDNKIFLLKRSNTGFMNGYYSLPAGRSKSGEVVSEGVVRELKEEAGVDATIEDLEFSLLMQRNSANSGLWLDVFFTCNKWDGEPINAEPESHSEGEWFDLADLPQVMPFQLEGIKAIAAGMKYIEVEAA